MKLVPCESCGAHLPASGCCPNCPCASRKLGVSAVALLGLIACNGGDDTDDTDSPGPEPEYGVPITDTDTDG